MSVWINEPPDGLLWTYPAGLPELLLPQGGTLFVELAPVGGSRIVAGTESLHYALNGGSFQTIQLEPVERFAQLYEATIPALECGAMLDYYFSVELVGAGEFTDPDGAPADLYHTLIAADINVEVENEFERGADDWTVVTEISVTAGIWELADPVQTVTTGGDIAQPEVDYTSAGTIAWITDGSGGVAGASDLDGGATTLVSPIMDLSGTDAIAISFAQWFFTSAPDEDSLTVEVSNNGGTDWTVAVTTTGTGSQWEVVSFFLNDFVEPSDQDRIRFTAEDAGGPNVVEAGFDAFLVERVLCEFLPCPTDLNGNGSTGPEDLAMLLGAWGLNPGHPADFNGNGSIGAEDLPVLLASWGDC